ncbi:MAG: trypsin-like serine protease [Polyangiaceae bacterium]
MHSSRVRALYLAICALPLFALGCAPGGIQSDDYEDTEEEGADQRSDEIIGGSAATGYPESVLISMKQSGTVVAICSGALVAPKLVLTAGHCVHGFDGWAITAPFASNQKANSSKGETYDWNNDSEYVDPNLHDLAVITLDTAITIATYPTIASTAVKVGSKVQNIGRIDNGKASYSKLFIGPAVAVKSGTSYGFPYDYVTSETIQSGDSGGPVVVPGTHQIVAVNSGAGGGTQVLARTDLLNSWLKDKISASSTTAPPASSDPCNGITYAGVCQSGTVVWCENNKLNQINCSASGRTCVAGTTPAVTTTAWVIAGLTGPRRGRYR